MYYNKKAYSRGVKFGSFINGYMHANDKKESKVESYSEPKPILAECGNFEMKPKKLQGDWDS